MRYLQAFCSITAHFRQILPVDLCNPEPLHWRGTCSFCCSVTASRLPPPDFASRCVKSLALAFMRYLQAFCSITAHFRQILNVVFVQSRALAFTRYVQFLLLGDGFTAPSARFCQQMCEIPSPCFNAVFTGFLLDHSSLPPDFARGFVQSRALALARYVQFLLLGDGFTAPSARFCQQMCEIPSPCFHAVFTSFLLDHSSLPPDFERGFCAIPSPCIHAVRAVFVAR